ncbi:laccase domain-containing protein [bacterium]|nr:MAG: laccase domain-containing protein [bacterium]
MSPVAEAPVTLSGLRHGFTAAADGDMSPAAARAAAGLGDVLTLKQVHGAVVHRAAPGLSVLEGDGWVSTGPAVGVFTADCSPLLLWSGDGRVVGAFHAGWRGLAAGMPEAAVRAMTDAGARDLSGALGPLIGPCCYEVGAEFAETFPAASLARRDGKLYFDQRAEALRRLAAAGLPAGRVAVSPECTSCGPTAYFSWRRDRVRRSLFSYIAPRAA